ncbi:hypothetical protein PENTCL1PPCAC_19704, partial [Pristionchus entomophagus]
FSGMVKILIEQSKPDIVFVIEKDMAAAQNKAFSGAVEDDGIFKFTQAKINFLSEHCGTVVIDDQFYKPHLTSGVTAIIVERLRSAKTNVSDFDDLRIERQEYLEEFRFGLRRLDGYKGANLIKNRVAEQLCEQKFCYFSNRDNLHAFYGDLALHQTTEMIEKLKPGYEKIIEDFLKVRNAKSASD